MRRRRAIEWALFGATSAAVAVLGVCAAVILAVGDPRPAGVGNLRGSAAAGSSEAAYRVVVLGDTQKGVSGMRRIIEATRAERPAFYVHTGDLVSRNDIGHYRWAMLALRRAALDAPLFVVPGNHDVKRGPELFTEYFESLEFAFPWGGICFVSIDNALGEPPPIEQVEARLRAAGGWPVVLFAHQPLFDTKESNARVDKYAPLLALLKRHGVRYVISGHAHTYRRVERDGIVHIANGVGGDSESWEFDAPVCATVLEADGQTVTDRKVELPAGRSLWDDVEHLALGEVGQGYRDAPVMAWMGTVVLIGAWGWLIWRLMRRGEGTAKTPDNQGQAS